MPEATKKDIGRAFKTIVAVLQAEDGVSLPLYTLLSAFWYSTMRPDMNSVEPFVDDMAWHSSLQLHPLA